MTAIILTFALTAFVTLVGVGAFLLLLRRFGLAELFLSPAMGVVVMICTILTLGKAGLPTTSFAWYVAAGGLALFGLGLFFVKKRGVKIELAGREAAIVVGLLAVAILSVAWPMFRFGFDWLCYTNEDMLNYTTSATYWLHHGYLSFPNAAQFLTNREMSNSYWFMVVFGHERVGVDYFLSFVLALTKLEGTRAFMSFIVMLYAAMVSAMVGMVLTTSGSRRATLFAAILMLVAALSAHGATYQLLGQEAGLGLLCLGTALMHRFLTTPNGEGTLALSITLGSIGLAYPEMFPFLVLAGVVSAVVNRAKLVPLPRLRTSLLIMAVTCVVIWNVQIPPIIYLLHSRVTSQGIVFMRANYQHFYLLPSGIPGFFGLTSLAAELADPWLSVSIALGLLILGLLIYCTVKQVKAGNTASCMMAVLGLAMISFFIHRAGFALFKLSMYCQPFIWAVFGMAAAAAYQRGGNQKRALALGFLVCLAFANFATEQYYVGQSRTLSMRDSSFLQVRDASDSRLVEVLTKEVGQKKNMIIFDLENPALGKLVSVYARGAELLFPSWDVISDVLGAGAATGRLNPFIPKWELEKGGEIQKERILRFQRAYYVMPKSTKPGVVVSGHTADPGFRVMHDGDSMDDEYNQFKMDRNLFMVDNRIVEDEPKIPRDVLVTGPPIANMNVEGENPIHDPVAVIPLRDIHNHLIFVRSSFGGIYLDDAAKYVGLYQPEADYFQGSDKGDTTMIAMGRYLVFNVLHPSPSLHLVINVSNTLRGNNAELPRPILLGKTSSAPMDVYGRGSARIISPAISPMDIKGQAFVALDLNQEPVSIEPPRTGLERLFGNDILMDPRRFVAYTRGISALSDAAYKALKPPTDVASFPGDLINNHGLEYSGIYEDGWASEDFALRLATVPGKPLSIEGVIPNAGDASFTTEATVFVNGAVAMKRRLGVGAFSIELPSTPGPTLLLRVQFSRAQHLSAEDRRVASMHIIRIGASVSGQGPVGLGNGWYPTEHYAGQTFHWMPESAEVQTQSDRPRDLALDVAPGPGVAHLPALLEVSGEGGEPVREQIAGRTTLHIPVAAGPHTIRLRVLNGGSRTASDPRILNVRAFSVRLER